MTIKNLLNNSNDGFCFELPSTYPELLEEREKVALEIRKIHNAGLPLEELEKRMLELDNYMEEVEDAIFLHEFE